MGTIGPLKGIKMPGDTTELTPVSLLPLSALCLPSSASATDLNSQVCREREQA